MLVSPVMMFYCFRTGHDAVLNTEDSAGCAGDPGSSRKARSKILKGRHSISCELPRLNQNDPCYVVTHDVLPVSVQDKMRFSMRKTVLGVLVIPFMSSLLFFCH